jgi:hypothetical protein
MEVLIKAHADFLIRPVELKEAAIGISKFREALSRASQTGKPFGLMSFGAGDIKALVQEVRVAGLMPVNMGDWQHVLDYAKLHDRVVSFSVRWNQFADLLSIPALSGGVQALRNIVLTTVAARKAHLLATDHDAHLPLLAEGVFTKVPTEQLHGTSVDILKVKDHLRAHLTRADLAINSIRRSGWLHGMRSCSVKCVGLRPW